MTSWFTNKTLSNLPPLLDSQLEELTEHMAALAPWSPSKSKYAGRCSLEFQWLYLDKRPPDNKEVDSKDSELSVRMGHALHSIYEHCLAGKAKTASFIDVAKQMVLTEHEIASMTPMLKNVGWFVERIKALAESQGYSTPIDIAALSAQGKIKQEYKYSITKDLTSSTDFFAKSVSILLRGVIDFIMFTPNKGAVIIDHKSSDYPSIKYNKPQLNTYALAILLSYPEVEWVQCGVHFMPIRQVIMDAVYTRNDLDTLKKGVFRDINTSIQKAQGLMYKTGNHCKWCNFVESCKAVRKEIREYVKGEAAAVEEEEVADSVE